MPVHAAARRGHILTLIFSAACLGWFVERPAFGQNIAPTASTATQDTLLPEPRFMTNWIDDATRKFGDGEGQLKNGFYLELSNMITGSGWLSAGPGYRRYLSHDQIVVEGSAAVSWHSYLMAQGRIELPTLASGRLMIGAQALWQDSTQVNYFGIGPDSFSIESQYRLQHADVVGYATVKPTDWLSVGGAGGWLMAPKVLAPAGAFSEHVPDSREQFPSDPGVGLIPQPNFFHGQAFVAVDTRDHRSYPRSGGVYRGTLTSFVDRTTGTSSFSRYEVEGAQFVPLVDRRWVLAFHGWALYSDVPSGHAIPFYLMPSLGGHNTLRDFDDYRFHDNNLLLVNGESRLALTEHFDAALFVDAGNVASQFGDLNLRKTSYGAGVRMHTARTTFGRLDVAYGSEGWRVVFRTSDSLELSRFKRHTAVVPFAP